MRAKELMWKYLIKEGKVKTDWSYYSGTIYDCETTYIIRDMLSFDELEIDWNKTGDVYDGLESCFNGTFHDNPDIKYLQGDLVLSTGEEYAFHMNTEDMSFTECINKVMEVLDD